MAPHYCQLKDQGLPPGSCSVRDGDSRAPACELTLKSDQSGISRLISAIHLSRPENYLSIYQSGCNMSCRKCHSWYFSRVKGGRWYSPKGILHVAQDYDRKVSLFERRRRATAWHAHETCLCCGACVISGRPSELCPRQLTPEQILLGPQGYGPARNIVAFTGGDLTCCPEFYAQCAELIKTHTRLWTLIETNGYGLTPQNLDLLQESGVDAFWLDIKAWDEKVHKWLTRVGNKHILALPEAMLRRGFVLEVLSLYIPEVVEADQLEKIARHLAAIDARIPVTLLAFFPEYRMSGHRAPTTAEMLDAYQRMKAAGLQNVRLGNLGVFVKTDEDKALLAHHMPHPCP